MQRTKLCVTADYPAGIQLWSKRQCVKSDIFCLHTLNILVISCGANLGSVHSCMPQLTIRKVFSCDPTLVHYISVVFMPQKCFVQVCWWGTDGSKYYK